jgi:peroxiredoxin
MPLTLMWSGAAAGGGAANGIAAGATGAEEIAHLELAGLDGDRATLADHRGSVVLLNFWATWCVPCLREMPALRDIQTRYGERGLAVIAASADPPARIDQVRRFVRRDRLQFPIWIGATTRDMERLELGEALPATALIDRDGRIAARFLGPFEAAVLEAWVVWLLGDRAGPAPGPERVTSPSFPGGQDEPGAAEPGAAEEEAAAEGHDHGHEGEEEHAHGGVGIEGASLVPS